jgi:hypothetical protein
MVEVVVKGNGQKEVYKKEKIAQSLKRLNFNQDEIENILFEIDKHLPSVITTKKLFQFIFNYLKDKKEVASYKYNLKKAILELGPAGYSFEKFIAHLLKLYDYKVKHNVFLTGKCLTYEIDVLAEKDNVTYIGECKFHQQSWQVNDIKVVLYSYARFLDIKNEKGNQHPFIITNTRFTSEVHKFANCYNIKLLSWDFPDENLPYLIDNKKAYPLTILDFLPLKSIQKFFTYDIVLIHDFINKDKNYLKKISGLNEMTIQKTFDIINNILGELTS